MKKLILVLTVLCLFSLCGTLTASQGRPILSYPEKVQLEADYILACQYLNDGHPAHGAINDVHGDPTWVVPRENGMAILGLLMAAEVLGDNSYADRANLSMDYLVRIQDQTDGSWCDQYSFENPVVLSKSPTQTAEVMMAMYMLGYREERYNSMKAAAQYLLECQVHGYNGLICGGKDDNGNFYGWNWITDNSYAYWALLAARSWALVKAENDFALECEQAAAEIINGIDNYFWRHLLGPDWWTIVDQLGQRFYFDDGYERISWMNIAPRFLDLPANGVDDPAVGEWIHTNLQVPSGNGGCIWGDAHPTQEYPGISFQSAFCWFDLGQTDYANAAVTWAENSGLWWTGPKLDPNGHIGGWIDWASVSDPQQHEQWWYRFIDTSFYSIAAWSGGYDFSVLDNLPPELSYIGNKYVLVYNPITFQISATDPESDSLTFSASDLPEDATFNEDTRTFSWVPQETGVFIVHFEVNDGFLIDSEEVNIRVWRKPKIIEPFQLAPREGEGHD